MHAPDQVKRNYLYQAGAQAVALLTPLVATPYLARILGPEGNGAYAYTFSVVSLFGLLIMLGMVNYGSRSIARVHPSSRSRTFGSLYALQAVRGLAVMALYGVFAGVFMQEYRALAWVQGLHLLAVMLDISWLYAGVEEFKPVALRQTAVKLTGLLLTLLLVKEPAHLARYAAVIAGCTVLGQVWLWQGAGRYVRRERVTWQDVKPHIRPELTLFLPVIAVNLYKMMDKVMLGGMSTMAQVGFYQQAEKIVSVPLGLVTALGAVMLPRLSAMAARGDEKGSERSIRQSLGWVMLLGSAFAFGLAAIAPVLAPVFLGRGYEPCAPLIMLQAASMPFFCWANVIRTQVLIPRQLDHAYVRSVLLGAVCNLAVNALLIPGMQAAGAAIGTIVAEGVVCISQTVAVRRMLPVGRYLRETLPLLAAGGVMFLAVRCLMRLLPVGVWPLMGGIGAGAAVYMLLVWCLCRRRNCR